MVPRDWGCHVHRFALLGCSIPATSTVEIVDPIEVRRRCGVPPEPANEKLKEVCENVQLYWNTLVHDLVPLFSKASSQNQSNFNPKAFPCSMRPTPPSKTCPQSCASWVSQDKLNPTGVPSPSARRASEVYLATKATFGSTFLRGMFEGRWQGYTMAIQLHCAQLPKAAAIFITSRHYFR